MTDNTTLDLIKSSVFVTKYTTMPPSSYSQTTFAKKIDIAGQIVIKDDSLLTDEQVPTQSGAIVWMPNQGIQCCFHMGFVPVAAQSPFGLGLPLQFGYVDECMLPYNDQFSNDPVKVTGFQQREVFQARLVAGILTLQCDASSVTATTISGTFSGAAIADIRDATLSTSTIGSQSICTPVQLTQAATTMDDGLKEVGALKGITAVMGPDINQEFQQPNAHKQYLASGGTVVGQHVIPLSFYQNHPTLDFGTPALMVWMTPYNIVMSTTAAAPADFPAICNIRIGATSSTQFGFDKAFVGQGINPFDGCLDVTIKSRVNPNTMGVAGVTNILHIKYLEVYASVSSNGKVYYTYNGQEFSGPNGDVRVLRSDMTFHTRTKIRMTGAVTAFDPTPTFKEESAGIYIGTMMLWEFRNTTFALSPLLQHSELADVQVCITTLNEYSSGCGELGPARVLRWDGMAPGQVIRVSGTLMAECMPGATTAAFVQNSSVTRSCENMNALPLLSMLYNSTDTPFKRIWIHEEFLKFLPKVQKFSCHTLRKYGNPRIIAAAAACGILNEPTCEEKYKVSGGMESDDEGDVLPYSGHKRSRRDDEDVQTTKSKLDRIDQILSGVEQSRVRSQYR